MPFTSTGGLGINDLDLTYKDVFGQPLMRMTFDYKENGQKMGLHIAQLVNNIAKSMNPTSFNPASGRSSWAVVPYQRSATPPPPGRSVR
jgi:gluconate 2-dehydrogenase alpha chain